MRPRKQTVVQNMRSRLYFIISDVAPSFAAKSIRVSGNTLSNSSIHHVLNQKSAR